MSESECAGRRRKRGAEDALCLGDKFMKLAYEILEDEPYASAQPPVCTNINTHRRCSTVHHDN